MRVAFLTNILSPYRVPLFEALADTPDWDLRVFVNAANEFDRRWGDLHHNLDIVRSRGLSFRRQFVTEHPVPMRQEITMHVPTGLWGDLCRFRPDVVIGHELGPRSAVGAAYAKLHGIPFVVWAYQSLSYASSVGRLRRYVRRWLLGQASAVIGMGTQARAVLRGWGADDARIFDAHNAVNSREIENRLQTVEHHDNVARIRREVGQGRQVALVVGRMIPMKATDRILSIWRSLDEEVRSVWRLVFVGDGPFSELVAECDSDDICHAGYVSGSDLPDWHAAADIGVFPSVADVWGLVVNESMLCGTPVVCSKHAGCCDDLIEDGHNGWAFDSIDAAGARRVLEKALADPDREIRSRRAQDTARGFTIEGMAEGFRSAIRSATERPALQTVSSI